MKQTTDVEFQTTTQDPQDGQLETPKTYSEEEYKNLQAFSTKANQALIETNVKLAKKDANELLSMDEKIQNKVIKEVWGYDNLEELKIMSPDTFNKKDETFSSPTADEESEFDRIKREHELLKLKLNKKDVDDEIDKFISLNGNVVKNIPGFTDKVREELKYISSELPAKERISRATKLVAGNSNLDVEAYLSLQGKTTVKSNVQTSSEEHVLKAQNLLREQLGLPRK